ncbi:Dolichyl-phosphate-mannose-protein mannosyltransferase-domain-containing protein [Dipodascopsis tothii]|uniref:Dolichyl-phosphate-mannose-protein mannosyltransferase-domain-containing protein n=1 Tax=Dipodascopsis tothii TaxID=44089 RepID=UPI0034CD5E30
MSKQPVKFATLPGQEKALLLFLIGVAVVVRLYKLWQPTSVVFDEVHFGGFATKYIKGRYFMDVHPPLAKLLITLAGFLAGFNGDFDFKDIGMDYLEPGVPYVAMRLLPAILGVLVIPICYMTLRAYGCQTSTASLGAALLIFDNALATQSRFILLDSPLIFFTALTVYAWANFQNQSGFDGNWFYYLFLTGLGLGATVSVKWVGLFTIAWVGVHTLSNLWDLLEDLTVTPAKYARHFAYRALFLIGVPAVFYMAMFAIHFVCLVNPGDGDGFMSSEFQATLNNKRMADVPADVAYGSHISLRHLNTQGGYLHSHDHLYPGGSKQQQVTLYPHKDDNNVWRIENATTEENVDYRAAAPIYLEDGSVIKLKHVATHRRLHSHDIRPPVTEAEWQQEVSAYGYEEFAGDANDFFRVEIVESKSKKGLARERVRTIETKFKLVHVLSGCSLFSHKVKLPSWAFEQQEVTCAKQGTLPNSIWYIEHNEHPMLGADAEKVNYERFGFFRKFFELQAVMWTTNAGLTASHTWDSRPSSWPVLRRGINFWNTEHKQVYLIGNPVVWWASSAVVAVFLAFKVVTIVRWQRGYNDYAREGVQQFNRVGLLVAGWALHYFPFFLMKRQLFLHHYLPALYFAVLALCVALDTVATRIVRVKLVSQAFNVALLAGTVYLYVMLSPLAYGDKWTRDKCENARLRPHWDFDCNSFYATYPEYDATTLVPNANVSVPADAAASAEIVVDAGTPAAHDEL